MTATAPVLPTRKPGLPVKQWADLVFRAVCAAAGMTVIGMAFGMVIILLIQAWPVVSHLWSYAVLTSAEWKPEANPPVFGALAFVYGTIMTSAIAMIIAVPLGIGAAAFLAEIASGSVRRIGAFLIELLAAVPSVVYGFWGIIFLRPIMDRFFHAVGQPNTASGGGILTAGILLAIMIVPYITAIAFDACRSVPRSQREAALALGATRWQMIWTAVLPYARPAIIAACLLALGRALGETMAVTMVIGNRTAIEWSISAVGDSMASVIANRLNEADSPLVRSALVTLGLLLLAITATLNILGRLLIRRMTRTASPTRIPIEEVATAPTATPELPIKADDYRLPRSRWSPIIDRIMSGLLAACLLIALVPLFLILFHVVRLGASSISWEFFTEIPKPLSTGSPGGLKHAIVGSLMIVGMTLVLAVPLGLLTAIFLAESQAYRLTAFIRFVTEVLGGVPSIVLGIFAYAVFVVPPFIKVDRPSFSAWAGAFALSVMMIPVVVRAAEEALRMVPSTLRQASFALGANYWQTVVRVLLPAAAPAILTGIILAASRIAGETAPLMLTAGGSNFMPRGPSSPTPFLPWYIFKYSTSAEPEYQRLAWSAALVLLVTVMVLNILTRLVSGKRVIAASRGD